MHCLAFVWSGHGYYSFNCDRAGLEAIHNGNMAHEGGFANKEFHLVDIQLDMTLFKSLKHGDKDAVVVTVRRDHKSHMGSPCQSVLSFILGLRKPRVT